MFFINYLIYNNFLLMDNIHPEWNGKKEHIGYINKIFNTKQQASDYYYMFNQHMRLINSELYVIRKHIRLKK